MATESSGGGGNGGSESRDHLDNSGPNRDNKKRFHRHTADQIQVLEAKFQECPHADEKTRLQLSKELGMAPKQIKYWFQNRRTHLKWKSEITDNFVLREENDRIRGENIAIKEAIKNAFCPTCGPPPARQGDSLEEQRLRVENAHLKVELERVKSLTAKHIGRPMSIFKQQADHFSSLDSCNGGAPSQMIIPTSGNGGNASSRTIDPSGSPIDPSGSRPMRLTGMDKSLMDDIVDIAMDDIPVSFSDFVNNIGSEDSPFAEAGNWVEIEPRKTRNRKTKFVQRSPLF